MYVVIREGRLMAGGPFVFFLRDAGFFLVLSGLLFVLLMGLLGCSIPRDSSKRQLVHA